MICHMTYLSRFREFRTNFKNSEKDFNVRISCRTKAQSIPEGLGLKMALGVKLKKITKTFFTIPLSSTYFLILWQAEYQWTTSWKITNSSTSILWLVNFYQSALIFAHSKNLHLKYFHRYQKFHPVWFSLNPKPITDNS